MDQSKPAGGMSGLIALQRSDQVPVDRHIRGTVLLLQCLLHPVLADISEAGINRGQNCFDPVGLGYRHDPHRVSASLLAPGSVPLFRARAPAWPEGLGNP